MYINIFGNFMKNKEVTFTFENLPKNVLELKKLKEAELNTPFETAVLTVLSLSQYPQSKENSIEMLNYLKGPQPLSPYEESFLRDRFRDKDYVPKSYFHGTSPDNNYTLNTPYKITVKENPYSYNEKGYAKLYLKSSGADNPRPIVLREKGGKWYLWEQMLLADIRIPVSEDVWK